MTPQTRAQWEAFLNETDARAAKRARTLAKKPSVTVENDKIGGVNVYRVTPAQIDPKHKHHLFVYLHGGAYIAYSGKAGTTEAVLIAARLKMPVLSIDYRMPPAYPAPAGINDVVSVYRQLLKKRTSASMAMGGSSAGGGLTMASVHRFKELGLVFTRSAIPGNPWSGCNQDRRQPLYQRRNRSRSCVLGRHSDSCAKDVCGKLRPETSIRFTDIRRL